MTCSRLVNDLSVPLTRTHKFLSVDVSKVSIITSPWENMFLIPSAFSYVTKAYRTFSNLHRWKVSNKQKTVIWYPFSVALSCFISLFFVVDIVAWFIVLSTICNCVLPRNGSQEMNKILIINKKVKFGFKKREGEFLPTAVLVRPLYTDNYVFLSDDSFYKFL